MKNNSVTTSHLTILVRLSGNNAQYSSRFELDYLAWRLVWGCTNQQSNSSRPACADLLERAFLFISVYFYFKEVWFLSSQHSTAHVVIGRGTARLDFGKLAPTR